LISEEEKIVFVPAAMGYYYRIPGSMLQGTLQQTERKAGSHSEALRPEETRRSKETKALMQRMFAQTGTREWDPVRVGHIYHPAVGFVDQW
jgi:hypothetical protein